MRNETFVKIFFLFHGKNKFCDSDGYQKAIGKFTEFLASMLSTEKLRHKHILKRLGAVGMLLVKNKNRMEI